MRPNNRTKKLGIPHFLTSAERVGKRQNGGKGERTKTTAAVDCDPKRGLNELEKKTLAEKIGGSRIAHSEISDPGKERKWMKKKKKKRGLSTTTG